MTNSLVECTCGHCLVDHASGTHRSRWPCEAADCECDDFRTEVCLDCEGEGSIDSGGVTPWGTFIDVPCPACSGEGLDPAGRPDITKCPECLPGALEYAELARLEHEMYCDYDGYSIYKRDVNGRT